MGEQPILSVKAHVYHIDRQTRKSWVMVSKQALPVSFFFDKQRNVYRIISVEGTRAVINSIVANSTVVRKTSHKFVQWADQRTDIVYGLGFAAESDVILFVEKFTEIKRKVAAATTAPDLNSDQALPNFTPPFHGSTHAESSTLPHQRNSTQTDDVLLSNHRNSSRPTRCSSAQPHNFSHSQSQHSNMRSNSNDHLPAFCESVEELTNQIGYAGSDIEKIRSDNARLVAALQRSAENVKKWEQELSRLREENHRLSKQQQQQQLELVTDKTKHDQFNSLPSSLKNRRSNSGCCTSNKNIPSSGAVQTDAIVNSVSPRSSQLQNFYEKSYTVPPNNLPGESLREQLRSIENIYDQVLLQNRHLHSILQDGRQRLVRVIAEVDNLAMADQSTATDSFAHSHYRLPPSTTHFYAASGLDSIATASSVERARATTNPADATTAVSLANKRSSNIRDESDQSDAVIAATAIKLKKEPDKK